MVQKISLGEFSCSVGGYKCYELIYGDGFSSIQTGLLFDSIFVELGVAPNVMFLNKDKGHLILPHLQRVERITPIGLDVSYRLYGMDLRNPKGNADISCIMNCYGSHNTRKGTKLCVTVN